VAGGVQDISLRELSRELGGSHTSPRRHFADKRALLNARALRGFERFDEILGRLTKVARAWLYPC
jgi:AcrR family transcriptional regulator